MLSAAILAGGRAERFGGRDKGALLVEGRSIRERQLTELSAIAHDVLIVGVERGAGLGPSPIPVRLVADRAPGCGPLGGLHTALLEATSEVTIVIACDMPFVTAAVLLHLATLAREADVVVPYAGDRYHPLCAAYTRACLEPAARRLAAGHLKMTGLFEDLRVRVVTDDELSRFGDVGRLLANVNSPAEIVALQGHQL